MSLQNKIIIVTGGSSGIGLAITKRLEKEGALVIIASRDSNRAKPHTSEKVIWIQTDVKDEQSVKNLLFEAVNTHGKVDGLINAAGMDDPLQYDIDALTEEDYRNLMDTNFKGTFLTTKHALSYLQKSKGRIINISSRLGLKPDDDTALYSAAKAAVIMFTKTMALRYAKDGILVNCICPGPVDTPLMEKVFDDNREEMEEWAKTGTPLGRMGKPEEIANIVNFLLSDEANWITGSIISVDGGQSL
jgi:NAD(P)-dependent dehydrogenase (short-subunit alcohol dehydrogenase family)